MLRFVKCLLLFVFILSVSKAEDHKAWALQQQKKSQELIKSFKKEAFALQGQTQPIKGCKGGKTAPCLQKPSLKLDQESAFYVFVSFSMPKDTLKALAREVKAHKGVLVIRGLVENSFVQTAKRLQEVGEGVILDPTLFKDYDVKVVPTFVLNHKHAYQKIAGNISLAYALEKFKGGAE